LSRQFIHGHDIFQGQMTRKWCNGTQV